MEDSKQQALAKALATARAEVSGTVFKAGEKREGGGGNYSYVGHEHVVRHVRGAMVSAGLSLVQTGTEFLGLVEFTTKFGKTELARWEGRFLLLHSDGGLLNLNLQCFTQCNDKNAFIASTALDRTALLRVMGLAGSADEDPEHDSNEPPRQQPAERVEQRQVHAAASAEVIAREIGALVAKLDAIKSDKDLIDWGALLSIYQAPPTAKEAAWTAFAARCDSLDVPPQMLKPSITAAAKQMRGGQ